MTFKEQSDQLMKVMLPTLRPSNKTGKVFSAALLAIILLGVYALFIQIRDGQSVTGMRDHVVWGIYTVNFIFFIGISYAGAIISGALHLLNVSWRKPIIRIAELIAVIATIIGPIYILLCMGRLDRVHHLFIDARLQSPIVWDVVAVITYLFGCILLLYITMIRDFALLRELNDSSIPSWRRNLYTKLSLNFTNTPKQNKKLKLSLDILSAIIIPTAVVVHSVLAWIFGMTLRPGWHSTIMGPYFVIAAIYSGTAVIVICMYLVRRKLNLESYLQNRHFKYLGYIMLVMGAIYGYFTFSEYLTDWYASEEWDAMLLERLLSPDHYGLMFFGSNIVGILIPIILIGIPAFRSVGSITFSSVLIVVSLWIKRYLIVIPTQETTLIPMQELCPEYISYSAKPARVNIHSTHVAEYDMYSGRSSCIGIRVVS
jgi:molybdopterin-containing oxidoreductase family membrane subunit